VERLEVSRGRVGGGWGKGGGGEGGGGGGVAPSCKSVAEATLVVFESPVVHVH